METNLNLNDLKNLLIILDYASDQGAFKGWNNIRKVLALRDKLDDFIKANSPDSADDKGDSEIQAVNQKAQQKQAQTKEKSTKKK